MGRVDYFKSNSTVSKVNNMMEMIGHLVVGECVLVLASNQTGFVDGYQAFICRFRQRNNISEVFWQAMNTMKFFVL